MPSKLTNKNYFSPKRVHLSNSQLNDYLKSPAFYKAKHIDKVVERKVTDPMKRGSFVDDVLTQKGDRYVCKVERTVGRFKRTTKKADNAALYEEETKLSKAQDAIYDAETALIEQQKLEFGEDYILSPTIYHQAKQVTDDLLDQPFWQEGLDKAIFQQVLEGVIEDMPVCGLPDRIDRTGEHTWRISDLKVVNPIKLDSKKKWMFNAQEMGYLRQAAIYRKLWADLQGVPVENVEFVHVVAAYVEPFFTKIKIFKIEPHLMDMSMDTVKEVLRNIKAKKFDTPMLTWDSAE